jgi:tRNA 2-selenouridine synthase
LKYVLLAYLQLMAERIRPDLSSAHFAELFMQNVPLLDVRAPVEFSTGAFPGAVNIPLLDDDQRHLIGLEYKAYGQPAAIDLGMRLATPVIRAERLEQWQQFTSNNPRGYLYCFRGGLRSRTTQQWLAESGFDYPLIRGGYKALRGYLLQQRQALGGLNNIVLLGGVTGVGKTALIETLSNAIDIEGRANHRGSAFGKTFQSQPAQIDWENQITIDWMRCAARTDEPILVEAESHLIGHICLPQDLQEAMVRAPIVMLEATMEERTERLYQEYVVISLAHYKSINVDPWDALYTSTLENIGRIKKRLGGPRYQNLTTLLTDAITDLQSRDDPSGFYLMIKTLLTEYYDPMYQHYQKQNQSRIIKRGNMLEIRAFLLDHAAGHNKAGIAPHATAPLP